MSLSIEIINGVGAIKEGDTLTDVKMKLIEGNGTAFDLTGKTATVILANKTGKILEKAATLGATTGEIVFGLDPADVTGYGQMFLEVHVTVSGQKRIFPSDGYVALKIDKNLNTVGTVVPTITIEAFELRVDQLESDVNAKIAYMDGRLSYYEGRFTVYETQYNSMVNLANNVNASLSNLANTANEYIMRAIAGADTTHTFTENYVGKVSGSTVANPHYAGTNVSSSALVAPNGLWGEASAAGITAVSTLNGVGATYTTALTAGLRAQFRVKFDLIEAVQRKYNIVLAGDTATKVAWLKQNLSALNFTVAGRGSSATGNKLSMGITSSLTATTYDVAAFHTSGSIQSISFGLVTPFNIGYYINSDGTLNFNMYADAASASVASQVIIDYFSLDVTLKLNLIKQFDGQTAVEYRINVLSPPAKTGLLPYVIGGNITTNTQRLQAMLNYLNTKGYGNLYFPNIGIDGIGEGRPYLINDTLLMNYTVDWAIPITIEGEDYGSYIQMEDQTKPLLNINGVNNVRDFRIKNLTLRGGTYGIRIRWGAYVFIENVSIRGCKTACMRFENTFGFCQDVWMFHTSSRLVEATGNGHIRWDVCTFGEDAGGFYLEDTEMSFNNCKFLQLKTYDTALTDVGIGGGDAVTGTKTRAIFYTLFNVNIWFTDCDFIHNEVESYLFYFVNSPAVHQFVNCKWEVGAGTSLFAYRNPNVYQYKTGLVLNSCEINGVTELYSFANSDAIRHLVIKNTVLPEATMIENDPNSAQLYEIGDGCIWT